MPRYVAFLRGVMPANADMATLRRCFEGAGFAAVRSVLASGNLVFDCAAATEAVLQQRAEAAMQQALGRSFPTVVRPVAALQALLAADPFAAHALPAGAKRVVSFLRQPPAALPVLPIEHEGVQILGCTGREVFTAYQPHPKGPVFMTLLERHFGRDQTTRTWDTVRKCAAA